VKQLPAQLELAAAEVKLAAAEMQKTRQKYEAAQAKFDQLLKSLAVSLLDGAGETARRSHDLTLAERLFKIFESNPGKSFTYEQLAQEMPGLSIKALRPLIHKLSKEGKIEKPGYGQFRLFSAGGKIDFGLSSG
jgi:hypothetical protein